MKTIITFCALFFSWSSSAMTQYELPAPGDNIVGQVQKIETVPGESLEVIARNYGTTLLAIRQANPQLGYNTLTSSGKTLYLGNAFILPPGPREGIVINLSELRLYYYPKDEAIVYTAPVSVGRPGWETPLTDHASIIEKKSNPTWHVPKSIKEDLQKKGILIANEFPPGPTNPLGQYMLRLSISGYLIHGTNEPYSIGKPVTAGCIRMYPEDIKWFYEHIEKNTPVRIINQPIKLGTYQGKLFIEAHPRIHNSKTQKEKMTSSEIAVDLKKLHLPMLEWLQANKIIARKRGYPEQMNNKITDLLIS